MLPTFSNVSRYHKPKGLKRALRDRGEDGRKEIDDPDDQIAPVRTRKAREPIAGAEKST